MVYVERTRDVMHACPTRQQFSRPTLNTIWFATAIGGHIRVFPDDQGLHGFDWTTMALLAIIEWLMVELEN
jgi:hypothetical protein